MAVRTKGRRKIMVDGNRYIWYVALDYDSPYYLLHISSEDKSFIITHPLNTNSPYIISKGLVFQGKRPTADGGDICCLFLFQKLLPPKMFPKLFGLQPRAKAGRK